MKEQTGSSYLDGQAFVRALQGGTLIQPTVVVGLVKKSEDDSDSVLFSLGAHCASTWVKIPAEMMAKVEVLSEVLCCGQMHHRVKITLKDADSKNVPAGVLAQLLQQSKQHSPLAGRLRRVASTGGKGTPVFDRPLPDPVECHRFYNPEDPEDWFVVCNEADGSQTVWGLWR